MRAWIFMAVMLGAGCAGSPLSQEDIEEVPLKPVPHVDLDRYMGRWYLIANIPYFAEVGNVGVYVEYTMREDGLIDDLYTARDGFGGEPFTKKGLVWITDTKHHAYGSITFLFPLWQAFTIVYLDDEYRYTAVAHPSRHYCWIFSREPHMSEEVYRDVLRVLKDNLFDVSRILKVPQTPEQVGAPGFQ